MKKNLEGLSVLLRFSGDFLDDFSLQRVIDVLGFRISKTELGKVFEVRCLDRGYAMRLDSEMGSECSVVVDFYRLYRMNTSSSVVGESSVCYVLVGDVLLSIPVTDIAICDIVTHVHSNLRRLISTPFVLHHMNADGERGGECIPGQSGSRFVVKTFRSPKPIPTSPRSKSGKLRSQSFDYPNVQCNRCIGNVPPPNVKTRQTTAAVTMRDSMELHARSRNQLFRSHSVEKRWCRAPNVVGSKVLGIYPPSSFPVSSVLFPMHRPVEFDLDRIRMRRQQQDDDVSFFSSSLKDSSPEVEVVVAGTPNNQRLLNVLQDLVSRRRTNAESAFNHAFQSLLGQEESRENEITRQYAPFKAHSVSRTVAIAEISRHLSDAALQEFLSLADVQGLRERPLLVQLERGQWSRLCPKDFRVASAMIGPTCGNGGFQAPPLPELGKGKLAETRLANEFSEKYMNNTVWRIKVKLEKFTNPIFFQEKKQFLTLPYCGIINFSHLVQQLTPEDCMQGFKEFPEQGVLVTKWSGLLLGTLNEDSVQLVLDRCSSMSDVVLELKRNLILKHKHVEFPLEIEKEEGLLRSDLHWCASEFFALSLERGPKLRLKRCFEPPDFQQTFQPPHAPTTSTSSSNQSSRMLWEELTERRWNSDDTSSFLHQFSTNRTEEGSSSTSPVARVRNFMARPSRGSEEAQDLGVDLHTEYSRYWIDEEGEGDSESSDIGVKGVKINIPTAGCSSLPPPTPQMIVARPTSPMSPVPRCRKFSKNFEKNPRHGKFSTKVIRSSKDTRQFEFHPHDPNLILTGSRSGVVSLINTEQDFALMQARVDTSAILGLSWLRAHINIALYGASSSGLVGVLKIGDTAIDHQPIGRFQNLSSVTVNCTDDYFLVSGFSRDVSLFDLVTGQKVSELREIHTNFINIIRFSHFNPHIFASSSFDSTCKLWDLRKKNSPSPVATYATPTLNVMCCFSPLDENLLVSGLDANVVQLSVKQGLVPNIPLDTLAQAIPAKNSTSNYRRAVYLADGARFITSGTDEDFMRVIDAKTGTSEGVYKFDGVLETFENRNHVSHEKCHINFPTSVEEHSIELSPRMIDPRSGGEGTIASCVKSPDYVQSLRGHPIFPREVGVLLYPFDRSRSSYICTAEIPTIMPQATGI